MRKLKRLGSKTERPSETERETDSEPDESSEFHFPSMIGNPTNQWPQEKIFAFCTYFFVIAKKQQEHDIYFLNWPSFIEY